MSNLTILRSYVQKAPEKLPASLLFQKSSKNIVIFDAYPKSIFHFLVLPRIQEPKLDVARLNNLVSLFNGDKDVAKDVIQAMADDAAKVKKEIEDEMMEMYGFKWEVWTGFHGAPSMAHLHLHVISADLCSEKLKHKKHYNSFHPKLGFFIHIDEVLSWFEATPTFLDSKVKALKASNYEPILKESLSCFRCNSEMKNIPTLKAHLQEEWDKLNRRAKKSKDLKKTAEAAESEPTTVDGSARNNSVETEVKRAMTSEENEQTTQ